MVAVVGRPTERKLRQVARTYYESARPVCYIHQYLCTLSCLCVFKSYVVFVFLLSYVFKVLCYRLCDIDFLKIYSKSFCQYLRVGLGTLSRAETRESYGKHALSVKPRHISGFNHYQKRECAVQTAGQSYYEFLASRMLYSLQKTFCLHSQYEFASFLSLFLSVRHERHIGNFTREFALLGFLVKVYYRVLLTGICSIVATHFVCALLDVDFADCHPVCKRFAFGKYRAAFRNEVMPRKNHVRSGFSFARVCIDVTAIESSRKRLYQQTAVCALAYHFVACRKIEYYSCALRYKVARGRISHPHIFAYLYAERIVLVISIYEYGLSERTISSRNRYLRIYNTLS